MSSSPQPVPLQAAHGVPSWRDGALLTLLVLALFGALEATQPGYFTWDDNATANLPSFVSNWRALMDHGELQAINLHQYAGQRWLASGQSHVLYPPTYLAAGFSEWVLGDLRWTLEVLAIGHLLFGALAMLWLLASSGVDRRTALLGALLWVSFPFIAQVSRNWIFVALVAALLPLNLLLLERLLRRPSLGAALALGVCKAVLFYQGHVNYAVMTAFFDGVWLLAGWVSDGARRRQPRATVIAYAQALLVSGVLAAPLLLPMVEAQQVSAYRAGRLPLEEFLSNPTPVLTLLKAQVGWMQPRVIHQGTGSILYIGLPILLLLGSTLWRRARAASDVAPAASPPHAAALAAIAALLLSTRAFVVLYPLPLFSSFRWPFKYFLFFLLFATVAAARSPWFTGGRRRLATTLLGLGVLGNVAVLLVPIFGQPFGPYHLERNVATIREAVDEVLPLDGASRVVSLYQPNWESDPERQLTHNYASLVGASHLGGYDPLIAADNLELALGLEYSNIYREPLDRTTLEHLNRWSVRHVITPADPRADAELDAWPQMVMRHRDRQLQVRENTAVLPLVSFVDSESGAVPITTKANGLDIAPGGRTGELRIALAPLRWWRARDESGQRLDLRVDEHRQLRISVPEGVQSIELRYRDPLLRAGTTLAASFMILVAFLAALRRRRRAGSTESAGASS